MAGRDPSGMRGCLPGSVDEQGLSHECGSSFFEIIFILLKAGMRAGSELCSIRSSLTARVVEGSRV